jgi:hypothetical protein
MQHMRLRNHEAGPFRIALAFQVKSKPEEYTVDGDPPPSAPLCKGDVYINHMTLPTASSRVHLPKRAMEMGYGDILVAPRSSVLDWTTSKRLGLWPRRMSKDVPTCNDASRGTDHGSTRVN